MTGSQDLEIYVRLGDSLWADPTQARRFLLDSMTAASLREPTQDRLIERAGAALLSCASRHGSAANARANGHRIADPFFRLQPEERFLLIALHYGRWSYARLARILEEPAERIEERAWIARVNLASSARGTGALPISYPIGSNGRSCPEYLPARPWTQRFLDEEFKVPSERIFLQNHLMACASCREALRRCRDLYFSIESLMPQPERPAQAGGTRFVDELRALCARGMKSQVPSQHSNLGALALFLLRRDVQWILLGSFFATLALKILGAIHR